MEQIISTKLYRESEYPEKEWAGGKTREIFICPKEASYDERNFVFRLSSATIEQEESQFTSLPNYDRTIMVLEGEVILSFEGTRVTRLSKWEQDQFDGKEITRSFGKIKDYNLMVLKGNRGSLEALTLGKERQEVSIPKEFRPQPFDGLILGFYCAQGFILVTTGDDIIRVGPGDQLILELNPGDVPSIGVMGEGVAIKSLVAYVNEPILEEIPVSRIITKEDIKAAFYIAYTNFRGSDLIFKSQRDVWYDPPLQKAINRIERIYLPLLIYILGMLFVIYGGMQVGTSEELWRWVLVWTAFDIFIITPGLFLFTLPRPIMKHMKAIKDLTPYEKRLCEKEKTTNIRLEKLLKKYAISGRNVGEEHEGKDYKSFRK
jgi:environmental stress-induced protein Ves